MEPLRGVCSPGPHGWGRGQGTPGINGGDRRRHEADAGTGRGTSAGLAGAPSTPEPRREPAEILGGAILPLHHRPQKGVPGGRPRGRRSTAPAHGCPACAAGGPCLGCLCRRALAASGGAGGCLLFAAGACRRAASSDLEGQQAGANGWKPAETRPAELPDHHRNCAAAGGNRGSTFGGRLYPAP